ncbi:hypothetical protein BC941DRAFT_469370 [Chlamydoabsidia padenii]|nr:hypothetical protein BC941DRAFT_469370 [Chlamydoabsidia padenii]
MTATATTGTTRSYLLPSSETLRDHKILQRKLVKTYNSLDPRIRPLLFMLKYFVKQVYFICRIYPLTN